MGLKTLIGQTNKWILKNKLQRKLRRGMTEPERILWQALRGKRMCGYKFRRQHPFDDFILDFVCLEAKLVIELDGGQHGGQMEADAVRTDKLARAGFRVLRFWNSEVVQAFEVVHERILSFLREQREAHPHPTSP